MRARTPPPQLLLAGWFGALALLIAGPLLGAGHLMLLDFVGGPRFPRFSFMPLPSSGEIGNTIPLLTLDAVVAWIHPYLAEKLLLVAPIVLGGVGVARFAVRRLGVDPLAAAYAGTVYVANPFVYDRLSAGQLDLLLGYGLLPWAFGALVRSLDEGGLLSAVRIAAWLSVLLAVSLHVGGMFVLVVLIASVVHGRWRTITLAVAALSVAALLSAYWLVPSLFATPGPRVGPADLEIYASWPNGVRVLPTLIGLHGFWRDEFAGATARVPPLTLLLIPILVLAAVGFGRLIRERRERTWAIALAGAAVLALFGAAGTSFTPTAGIFRWALEHLPFLGVYREPQKLVAILALAYALLGAAGVNALLEILARRHKPLRIGARGVLVTMALVGTTLAYTYPILWGLWGDASLVRLPPGWQQAESAMERTGPGRALVLPWTLYGVWSFGGRRILANPALSYFSQDLLVSDEAGFPDFPSQTRDPFSAYITEVLEHRDEVRAFGHLVAPLGVRYVILLHEIDWPAYGFLKHQPDLNPIVRNDNLVVYENEAWHGDVLDLSGATSIRGPEDVIGQREEKRVDESLFLAPPLVLPAADGLPAVSAILPAALTIPPSSGSHVSIGVRCSDGWRLGSEEALCHLGAVAAFEASDEPRTLRAGLIGAWALGYTVSLASLAAVIAGRRIRASSARTRTRSEAEP